MSRQLMLDGEVVTVEEAGGGYASSATPEWSVAPHRVSHLVVKWSNGRFTVVDSPHLPLRQLTADDLKRLLADTDAHGTSPS